MDAMLKAVTRLQKIEEQQRDRVGMQLENLRQKSQHLQSQLGRLSELKSHHAQQAGAAGLNSVSLMNLTLVDQLLHNVLVHHQQEQALMQAQCTSMQKEFEHKHARVKGMEGALERWRKKQNYEKARKEQKAIEEIIAIHYCRKKQMGW